VYSEYIVGFNGFARCVYSNLPSIRVVEGLLKRSSMCCADFAFSSGNGGGKQNCIICLPASSGTASMCQLVAAGSLSTVFISAECPRRSTRSSI
jgi:hypothetical protein